jgi:hypothetical protein
MAKQNSVGGYICGHCDATDMQVIRYQDKGRGVTRIHLKCNKCGGEDYYDSCGNG